MGVCYTIIVVALSTDILHRLTDISYFYSLFGTGTCVVIGIAVIVNLSVKILSAKLKQG